MLDNKKGNDKPKKDRIKFEPAESKECIVESEYCKVYFDSVSKQTFKVIDGYVVPIELREFNMWKRWKNNPHDFSIETVRDAAGEIDNYVISKRTSSPSSAQSATAVSMQGNRVAQQSSVNVVSGQTASAQRPTVTNKVSTAATANTPHLPTSRTVSPNEAATAVAFANTTDLKKLMEEQRKRKPKSTRLCKCAICGNEYKDEELMLSGNRNYCFNCIDTLIQEKMTGSPVDPVEKAVYDITTADEIYCTYSSVTGYPFLDENDCVNVCTVSRAAELTDDTTTVESITEKGTFFDDLKRFGIRKIIVNNDHENIFEPEQFDEHVKTDGLTAPELYFNIIDCVQKDDDEIRKKIAPMFLKSTLYVLSIDDEILEITEDNLDSFKPLTLSNGMAKICPVFTDVIEARKVNLSFNGVYIIKAELLPDDGTTHYLVNPASVGFMVNRKTLEAYIATEQKSDDVKDSVEESHENVKEPTTEILQNDENNAQNENAPVNTAAAEIKTNESEQTVDNKNTVKESVNQVIKSENIEVTSNDKPVEQNKLTNNNVTAEALTAQQTKPVESVSSPAESSKTFKSEPIKQEEEKQEPVIDEVVKETVDATSLDDLVSGLTSFEDDDNSLDLSGFLLNTEPVGEEKPKKSVQDMIGDINTLYSEIDRTADPTVIKDIQKMIEDKKNELCKSLVDCECLYAQYDSHTKHILIDANNRGHIYSSKEIADQANIYYTGRGLEVYSQKFDKKDLLTMVYEFKRHGIQDLILDESANSTVITTDSLYALLNIDNDDLTKIPVINPELMFSMTTLFQKRQLKVDYPNRKNDINALERRMIREFTSARYIMPLIVERNGASRPVVVNGKNNVQKVLVFSDVFEMRRFFGARFELIKDYNILSYKELTTKYISDNSFPVLNEGSLKFDFNRNNCEIISRL